MERRTALVRMPAWASAVVLLAFAAVGTLFAGVDDKDQDQATAKNKAVLAKLEENIALTFDHAPFQDVLKYVKAATQGPNDSGVPIFVDPETLRKAGKSITTLVSIDTKGQPLKDGLKRLLRPMGLNYKVEDGLLHVVLWTPEDKTRAVRASLEEPIELRLKDVPLQDAFKSIRTFTRGPDHEAGIPIYVDPVGLQEAEATMLTRVSVDSKPREPLKSSLRRMLNSVKLDFTVKQGLITVTSVDSLDEEFDENGKVPGRP
jgi:hypothetical protein